MSKATKKDLMIELALTNETLATIAKAEKWTKDDLEGFLELQEAGFKHSCLTAAKRDMQSTLKKYREGYQATQAYSGKSSLCNGDDVAQLLAGCAPKEACTMAENLLDLDENTLWDRYKHLNLGQIRMNAGNRIRGAIKRGELDIGDLLTA
jgi:hypothetical protein